MLRLVSRFFLLTIVLVFLLTCIPLQANAQETSNELTPSIELKSSEYGAFEPLSTRFTLSNNSDMPLAVLTWNTPLEGFNQDVFLVQKSGEPVNYIGRLVKRGAPQPEDYITLKPGETVSAEVDLSQAYAIYEPGNYSVTFKADLLDVGSASPNELAAKAKSQGLISPKTIESNTATFDLLGSRPKSVPEALSKETLDLKPDDILAMGTNVAKQTPVFRGCSAERQISLNEALTQAERITDVALFDLQNTPVSSRSDAQRYKTWFGNYTATRYDQVSNNFDKIYDALANKTITFDCGCNESWYAYVYPNRPYEIFLCNAFWTAPLTGTDSKAGVIVHETSHFNVVAGTDDHVYGQAGCRNLANTNPAQAIENADSHEYFAENTPALSMPSEISACSLCSTCGGLWPNYSGTIGKITPAPSYAPKERGSACSGSIGYRNDTYPYLCCQ